MVKKGHELKFKELKIIDKEANLVKRKISEICHIILQKNEVNLKMDTQD